MQEEESLSDDGSRALTPAASLRTKKETERLIEQYAVASYGNTKYDASFQKGSYKVEDLLNRFDREHTDPSDNYLPLPRTRTRPNV